MDRPGVNKQITWVYTHNLETTKAFYGQVLGLDCVRDEGKAQIFRVSSDAMIGVCEVFGDRVVEPQGGMITLVTDDVDAWYDRLVQAGAGTRGAPRRMAEFNIYTFFAEDPNGYVIEFQQFLDSKWLNDTG